MRGGLRSAIVSLFRREEQKVGYVILTKSGGSGEVPTMPFIDGRAVTIAKDGTGWAGGEVVGYACELPRGDNNLSSAKLFLPGLKQAPIAVRIKQLVSAQYIGHNFSCLNQELAPRLSKFFDTEWGPKVLEVLWPSGRSGDPLVGIDLIGREVTRISRGDDGTISLFAGESCLGICVALRPVIQDGHTFEKFLFFPDRMSLPE